MEMYLDKHLKIALQLDLEIPNTHDMEIEKVHHLCSAFLFHYRTFISDEYTLHIDLYIPANNSIYEADFKSIVKTFALFYGYYILNSRIIEMPFYDFECLDGVGMENERQV